MANVLFLCYLYCTKKTDCFTDTARPRCLKQLEKLKSILLIFFSVFAGRSRHGMSCSLAFRIRFRFDPESPANHRCDHLRRTIFETIRFFGDPLMPKQKILHIPNSHIPIDSLSFTSFTPIVCTKKEYIGTYQSYFVPMSK